MAMHKAQLQKALAPLRDDPDALVAIILRQAEQIDQLQRQVAALTARVNELEEQPPRSTAPFRIAEKKCKRSPKGPGRQKGHEASYRQAPEITEEISVDLSLCPCCGAPVRNTRKVEQIIEELPAIVPRVVKLTTYKALCPTCGPIRSSHPLQVSQAVGAAGCHLGPSVLSLASRLQYQWHLSKRKTCQIIEQLFGIRLSAGGLVQATHRLADRLTPEYKALSDQVQKANVLHSDETSWYVGKPGHSLWVFTNEALTLYQVVAHRDRKTLYQVIGKDFSGVLISDCLAVYDQASEIQHKCYSHHLKAISKAMDLHPERGNGFLHEVKMLLKSAMALKQSKADLLPATYQSLCRNLEKNADHLLLEPRGQPQEEAIRIRLIKQRDHLFTFLYYDGVEATNNLAERQLRPAVIARKLSCGNRTEKGARTWQTMASIATTCQQNGQVLNDLIINALLRQLQPQTIR